jgi:excinuclease ABC subunit A
MKIVKSGETADGAGGAHEFVRVRGAREHNPKSVDGDIPRDALVVFTGVSGSGKSSLAFGTLYAEAQRRYRESVAPYVRRLFHQMGFFSASLQNQGDRQWLHTAWLSRKPMVVWNSIQ